MEHLAWLIIPGVIGFAIVFFAPIILSLTDNR